MDTIRRSCIDCGQVNCDVQNRTYPPFCLSTHMDEKIRAEAIELCMLPENAAVMQTAAQVEYEYYNQLTRVQEIVEFAKRMKFHKIGIATCVGLIRESGILAKILRNQGFEVFGIACKAGLVPKPEIGIDEACCAVGVNTCNPILQAKMLNREKTELNIVMGLCVGHDAMFYKYSKALVTTLVTKDRVLGHNPVAALYTADSYYRKKVYKQER
jgi:uncharacterized metal-binding protein